MADNFITLSNRLLGRCPAVGIELAKQFVNDAWHTMQSRREWSFRRRSGVIAPPTLYNTGYASTNVSTGNPYMISGTNTVWTADMVGRQIRIGGLLYPFYDVVGVLSPTSIIIGQPWAGPDVTAKSYQIVQCFYPMPSDYGYMYAIVSIKDGYKLWTTLTESDLAIMDPQRTNFGQTYVCVFKDYSPQYGGIIGPVIPVLNPSDPSPVSTTTVGYTYVTNATYIIQVVTPGVMGTATFQWMRAGQTSFQPTVFTSDSPQDLSDGVQIYWPDGVYYSQADLFIINCQSLISGAVPRNELWPCPTYSGYLYPYIYISKESDLTMQAPSLPPFIANRGEVLLEMALEKCAEFPGTGPDNVNIYHDLRQAQYHANKVKDYLIDLERNDEEIGVGNIDYQSIQDAPSPWQDGSWQQRHSPWLNG